MDTLIEFKKFFNRDFWKAFQDKQFFFDIPKNKVNKDEFIKNLHTEILERKYYPSVPQNYIDVNKGNGVTRIVPVFTLKDYCVYYYCIKKIEDKIAYNRVENTFGGWTLGGLMRKSEHDEIERKRKHFNEYEEFMAEISGFSISEYSFNPLAWAKAYGDLNAKLYATAMSGKYGYVVELDIANYYDSIRLDILETRIREIVNEKFADVVSLLFHFLNFWNRKVNIYNRQTVGLPQDAMGDCSRILANFYLQTYDKIIHELCEDKKCEYLRYADDQFLFTKDKESLNVLIFKVSKQLNSLGLSVNQKKVHTMSAKNLIESRCFKIFDLLKKKEDKEDPEKVEKFVDCYLNLEIDNKLDTVKGGGTHLLNKALFCPAIKEIDPHKKTKLIACYMNEEYLIKSNSIHFEKIFDLLDQGARNNFIDKLNYLSKKQIHSAFHYQLLNFFIKKNLGTDDLRKRIEELRDL